MGEGVNRPWKVVSYSVCSECGHGSIGVQANGRIVRHSYTFGGE